MEVRIEQIEYDIRIVGKGKPVKTERVVKTTPLNGNRFYIMKPPAPC